MAYKKHKQYRLYGYDYSQDGAYFITIVTKNRLHHFGEIIDNKMRLSPIGEFVAHNFSIVEERIHHLQVDESVIMPNHLHLIISIPNKNPDEGWQIVEGLQPMVKKSISSFTNQLKGAIKRWCNRNDHLDFEWQARFHDRIIRDEHEYYAIANYIRNNIANWKNDYEFVPDAPQKEE